MNGKTRPSPKKRFSRPNTGKKIADRQGAGEKPGMGARLVAATLLTRVIDDHRNLDALCDREHGLKNYLALEGRDRALARAIAITAFRNRNWIEVALSKAWDRPPPKKARFLHHMLHVAVAQILFLDTPDRAAVDLAVSAIGNDERTTRFRAMSNAVLRRIVREKEKFLSQASNGLSPFPKWFEKMLRQDYGKERVGEISRFVTKEALVDLTVKSEPEKWAERLEGFVLPTGTVRLTNTGTIESLEGYEEGEWWVQDAAAALPANLINAPEGSDVLELCAAPGGKTAQLCHAGFKVTALDISKPRLSRLATNLDRLKLEAELVEADILEWQPGQEYDAVLLDTPCSSTGIIRRHPDILWTRTATEIEELAELQFNLVCKAAGFVKPGGTLVFSNCSIFKKEGENLIPRILDTLPDFSLSKINPDEVYGLDACVNGQGVIRTLPFHLQMQGDQGSESLVGSGLDGFFAARFTRNQ